MRQPHNFWEQHQAKESTIPNVHDKRWRGLSSLAAQSIPDRSAVAGADPGCQAVHERHTAGTVVAAGCVCGG